MVADIIDGEAVIMNLEKGDYYSLDLIGADVWRLIVAGHTVGEIAAALADRYGIAPQQAEADVGALSAQLVSESLILAADGGKAQAGPIATAELAAPAYQAPHLHVYADMKDLLALDPPLPEFKRAPGN
ncbi:MAG: PqqD family protein [Bauldia sp.]